LTDCCLYVYVDDLLIYSPNAELHTKDLMAVLEMLNFDGAVALSLARGTRCAELLEVCLISHHQSRASPFLRIQGKVHHAGKDGRGWQMA
jgi:hypothetical protein